MHPKQDRRRSDGDFFAILAHTDPISMYHLLVYGNLLIYTGIYNPLRDAKSNAYEAINGPSPNQQVWLPTFMGNIGGPGDHDQCHHDEAPICSPSLTIMNNHQLSSTSHDSSSLGRDLIRPNVIPFLQVMQKHEIIGDTIHTELFFHFCLRPTIRVYSLIMNGLERQPISMIYSSTIYLLYFIHSFIHIIHSFIHTYRHTDRQTYIQAYMQTYRQTYWRVELIDIFAILQRLPPSPVLLGGTSSSWLMSDAQRPRFASYAG